MISEVMNGPGWKVRGDFVALNADNIGLFVPRMKHIIKALPMLLRFFVYIFISWWKGNGTFINIFRVMRKKSFYGVPCGGIGCGSIGRDFRGGFCKYSLLPGIVEQDVESIKANQFIVSVRKASDNVCVYQKVLSCVSYRDCALGSWDFGFAADKITYRGLYPRSWTQYEIPDLGVVLICKQISPVLPNNYKDTCLPVSLFVWTIQNESSNDYNVSITFTFRNGTGNESLHDKGTLCRSDEFIVDCCSGIKLMHSLKGMKVCYGLAANENDGISVSKARFDPSSSGDFLWNTLLRNGNFVGAQCETDNEKADLAVALCTNFLTRRESSSESEFILVWDMPSVKFGGHRRQYTRRYARFFTEPSKRTEQMCVYGLRSRTEWEKRIDDWQAVIVDDETLPEWYKSALFNESYFLTDGGSCWFEYDAKWLQQEKQMSAESIAHFKEYGRFAYLEAWEYLMLNTYDVHFYASFALLRNWPMLELSVQLDFADQVLSSVSQVSVNLNEATTTEIKKRGRIPHDLGNPSNDPWLHPNAYNLNDTSEWKDLNLKFVLTCYRDYERIVKVHMNDEEKKERLLKRFYELSVGIIADGLVWDVDGDDLIENSGRPDQTYDVWSMSGSSAYCGGLWLCALECLRRMASALGRSEDVNYYDVKLNNAKKAFNEKLWNGQYFDFDQYSACHKSIMADQLCGFWFMSVVDGHVDENIVTKEQVRTTLQTIYENNVERFADGQMGAVNAMTASGEVDRTSVQSEEVWGGVVYALASLHIITGQNKPGFEIAEGWYRSCWERFGLQYQTPEAINASPCYYRAIGYMRPLCVWAMQNALDEMSKVQLENSGKLPKLHVKLVHS